MCLFQLRMLIVFEVVCKILQDDIFLIMLSYFSIVNLVEYCVLSGKVKNLEMKL